MYYFYTWSMSYVDSNYIRFFGGVVDGSDDVVVVGGGCW